MSRRVAVLVLSGGVTLLGVATGAAPRADGQKGRAGAELNYLDHYDVSPPLREMPVIPPNWQEMSEHPVKMLPHHHPLHPLGSRPDLALQASPSALAPGGIGPLVNTTPGLNFDGVGVPNYTIGGAPPDTNGSMGATQYVQWVNTAFGVFDKTSGALVFGPANGNTLWQGFGGSCETDNDGDPIVLYDKAANRWIFTQFAVTAQPYMQCIAVSTTSDATGSYRRFAYSFGNGFNDYPKLGVWPDAYYITFNIFTNGATFAGAKVCAFDRNQMITASGTPGPMQCFQLSTTYGGLLPADLDGATPPPAGAPNYVLAFNDVTLNGLNLWRFHVDWVTPASSTFTGPTSIPVTAFTEACNGGTCITQPSTTQQLDSLADRLMFRLAYRNFGDHESLVVNHSVDVGGHSGVRWYEVRNPGGTPSVFQQGTFSPDATHRWMGSIAMDQAGNMLLGYSASSGSVRPSVRYTGRLAGDPLGTMQTESEMFTGLGSQTGSLSRWGDYSAMSVDPVDDCSFWYTNEDLKTTGSFNWSTRIASFKFASCGGTPDFSLSVSPASVTVPAGNPATYTVNITPTGGFTGAVSLAISGLPSGASGSFSPNPAGGTTSTLTVTTSTSTPVGSSTFTVTGTSGSLSHTASGTLVVQAPATPDFSIGVSPASVAVVQGGSGNTTTTVTSLNGFSAATTLSASGLPSGVTATFSANPVTPPAGGSATSTLTLTASPTAALGTATVTVTGTSGSLTHSATFSLTVTSANSAAFDPTLRAPKCAAAGNLCDSGTLLVGRRTLGPEPNQPNTINGSCADGASGTFHSDESNDRIVVSTTDGTVFAPGKTVRIDATVWAWTTPSSDHLDLYYTANANSPSWTFITTLTPTAAGAQTLSATYTLPAGALQAVRAHFRFTGSATSCSTGAYDDHDDLIFAVNNPPDTTPPTTSITAPVNGATVSGTTTITASASDNVGVTRVEFYVDSVLKSTDTTAPYSYAWDTTAYGNGSHSIFSQAYDAANNVGTSATVTVTVNNVAGAAAYDPTLKAPKCAVLASSCDSGTLLNGRRTLGPEPNQPNTINNSCADGASGTYHSDESNDRIVVSSLDGTNFAAGKTVRISATVWAWTTPSSDHLDLYYTANANSPVWTYITTLTPAAAGAQTLSATYTLPAGSLQAVRAQFRFTGSATPCSTGAYDDHDDLIFVVQ